MASQPILFYKGHSSGPSSYCFSRVRLVQENRLIAGNSPFHFQKDGFRLSLPNLDRFTKAMSSAAGSAEIMTIREVAEYLKVNERTIYRLLSAKKLPAFTVGGSWRFRRADIDGWIASQSEGGAGES